MSQTYMIEKWGKSVLSNIRKMNPDHFCVCSSTKKDKEGYCKIKLRNNTNGPCHFKCTTKNIKDVKKAEQYSKPYPGFTCEEPPKPSPAMAPIRHRTTLSEPLPADLSDLIHSRNPEYYEQRSKDDDRHKQILVDRVEAEKQLEKKRSRSRSPFSRFRMSQKRRKTRRRRKRKRSKRRRKRSRQRSRQRKKRKVRRKRSRRAKK